MADVSSELVKQLREKTGAGMMDCKKALVDSKGDLEKALVFLREKGLASAEKKSSRATKEGVVSSYIHGNGRIGVMIEVNCETDFVAKNEKFQSFVKDIAMHIAAITKYIKRRRCSLQKLKLLKSKYKKQIEGSGKPANVIEKIVEGKFKKYCRRVLF